MSEKIVIQFQQHLKAALSKRPGWAAGLWGETGVGKTFTVQSLLRQTPLRSLSLPATLSVQEMLRHFPHFSRLPAWVAAQLERLSQGQPVELQCLVDLVAASLSSFAPFVLHLEDIHETSPERLDLIQKLARIVPRLRGVGLIVTSRSELPEPFKGYRLLPLNQTQSDELLDAQVQSKLPREGLDWIFARTQGNPLFALEFLTYLTRRGFLWSDGQIWHWRVPPDDFVPMTVEALISQGIANWASTPARLAVLQARAVLPLEVSNQVWLKVAEVEPQAFTQALSDLTQGGLLRDGGFTHPLIPEVLRHELYPHRRRGYATRALEALEQDPVLAARYLEDAGLEAEEVILRLETAASKAKNLGDLGGAARLLARAAQYGNGENRARLALEAATWLRDLDVPECERLSKVAMEVPAYRKPAILLCHSALLSSARIPEAWKLLESLPQSEQDSLEGWQMRLHNHRADHQYQEVVNLWESHPEFQPVATANDLQRVIGTWVDMGELEKANQLMDLSLERADLTPQGRAKILDLRNAVLYRQARYAEVEAQLGLMLSWLNEQTHPMDCSHYYRGRSLVRTRLGNHHGARTDVEKACQLLLSTGAMNNYVLLQTSLGLALIYEREYVAAERVLLEALEFAQRYDPAELFECYGHLSFLYLRWESPHGLLLARRFARLSLEAARALGRESALEAALEDCARAELLCNAPESALKYAQELEQLASRSGLEADLIASGSLLGRAYARLGQRETALAYLSRAVEQFHTNGQTAEALITGLEIDRLECDTEAAAQKLAWFETHGELFYADRVRTHFPELAQRPAPTPQPAPFRLKVLGSVTLERSDQPFSMRAKKRLEILCYLLETRLAGKSEANLLELLDAFYPEMPEQQAKLTLRQQIYLIRGSLGAQSIQSTPNGYALGAVDSDVESFLKTGDSQLWRGVYLQGLSDGWNANLRESLELSLRSSVENLLEPDPAEAARLAQIWLEMEPYDLQALHLSLQALQRVNTKAAERLYAQAQARMLEVGEALPQRLEDFLDSELVS